jgi:hypothetical protein
MLFMMIETRRTAKGARLEQHPFIVPLSWLRAMATAAAGILPLDRRSWQKK